ncbi:MAG: methyltransferase domain-containing protein [Rhodobacteraceae bacterium]|nr:methyltransferase domain-containing protein [Paracoccaceae bacterium]
MASRFDWNPDLYGRFHGLRLRPALDLLARVGDLPSGEVIDLGCGSGAAGPALSARFGKRHKLIGLDASPAMLKDAAAAGDYDQLIHADAEKWEADTPPALIYSNAALHWLTDHGVLMPRLADQLQPGGVLAVQMPRQFGAPSHRFLRDFAGEMFPDRFDLAQWKASVASPVEYFRMLAPLGQIDVWETDYVQRLEPSPDGHPVLSFTQATAMRPYLEKLRPDEVDAFRSRYNKALSSAYPIEPDGTVLFPFRRLFFVLRKAG